MVYCSSCYRKLETTGACPFCCNPSVQHEEKVVVPVYDMPVYDIKVAAESLVFTTEAKSVH